MNKSIVFAIAVAAILSFSEATAFAQAAVANNANRLILITYTQPAGSGGGAGVQNTVLGEFENQQACKAAGAVAIFVPQAPPTGPTYLYWGFICVPAGK
jgi:hypothetical protein